MVAPLAKRPLKTVKSALPSAIKSVMDLNFTTLLFTSLQMILRLKSTGLANNASQATNWGQVASLALSQTQTL